MEYIVTMIVLSKPLVLPKPFATTNNIPSAMICRISYIFFILHKQGIYTYNYYNNNGYNFIKFNITKAGFDITICNVYFLNNFIINFHIF